MLTSGRPDLDAYNAALTMSTAELVSNLRDLLGAKLVAPALLSEVSDWVAEFRRTTP